MSAKRAIPLDRQAATLTLPLHISDILERAASCWLQNSQVYDLLTNSDMYGFKASQTPACRPSGGKLFIYERGIVRNFRNDGHVWKKKSDGRSVRETHEKLKVQGSVSLNCYYAHSVDEAIQRRSYWLLSAGSDGVVLVHYLRVTPTDIKPRGKVVKRLGKRNTVVDTSNDEPSSSGVEEAEGGSGCAPDPAIDWPDDLQKQDLPSANGLDSYLGNCTAFSEQGGQQHPTVLQTQSSSVIFGRAPTLPPGGQRSSSGTSLCPIRTLSSPVMGSSQHSPTPRTMRARTASYNSTTSPKLAFTTTPPAHTLLVDHGRNSGEPDTNAFDPLLNSTAALKHTSHSFSTLRSVITGCDCNFAVPSGTGLGPLLGLTRGSANHVTTPVTGSTAAQEGLSHNRSLPSPFNQHLLQKQVQRERQQCCNLLTRPTSKPRTAPSSPLWPPHSRIPFERLVDSSSLPSSVSAGGNDGSCAPTAGGGGGIPHVRQISTGYPYLSHGSSDSNAVQPNDSECSVVLDDMLAETLSSPGHLAMEHSLAELLYPGTATLSPQLTNAGSLAMETSPVDAAAVNPSSPAGYLVAEHSLVDLAYAHPMENGRPKRRHARSSSNTSAPATPTGGMSALLLDSPVQCSGNGSPGKGPGGSSWPCEQRPGGGSTSRREPSALRFSGSGGNPFYAADLQRLQTLPDDVSAMPSAGREQDEEQLLVDWLNGADGSDSEAVTHPPHKRSQSMNLPLRHEDDSGNASHLMPAPPLQWRLPVAMQCGHRGVLPMAEAPWLGTPSALPVLQGTQGIKKPWPSTPGMFASHGGTRGDNGGSSDHGGRTRRSADGRLPSTKPRPRRTEDNTLRGADWSSTASGSHGLGSSAAAVAATRGSAVPVLGAVASGSNHAGSVCYPGHVADAQLPRSGAMLGRQISSPLLAAATPGPMLHGTPQPPNLKCEALPVVQQPPHSPVPFNINVRGTVGQGLKPLSPFQQEAQQQKYRSTTNLCQDHNHDTLYQSQQQQQQQQQRQLSRLVTSGTTTTAGSSSTGLHDMQLSLQDLGAAVATAGRTFSWGQQQHLQQHHQPRQQQQQAQRQQQQRIGSGGSVTTSMSAFAELAMQQQLAPSLHGSLAVDVGGSGSGSLPWRGEEDMFALNAFRT